MSEVHVNTVMKDLLGMKISTIEKSMRERFIRWPILMLSCFFIVSRHYNYDIPQGIQVPLENELALSSFKYNLLYTVYSIPNIIWPLFAGAIIDKIGCRLSILIFGSLVVFGQSLFTFGCFQQNFILLLAGRACLGIGGEAVFVIKIPIAARWFRPREQGLAMGILFAASRAGSILQSSVTPFVFQQTSSIGYAAMAGAILSVFSLLSGVIWVIIDKSAENYDRERRMIPSVRRLSLAAIFDSDASRMEMSQIKSIPFLIILIAINAAFVYGTNFTFLGNANQFLQDRSGLSSVEAGSYISYLYIASTIGCLLFGKLVDMIGRRIIGILVGTGLFAIVYIVLILIPNCDGCITYLFPMLLLGVALALWTCCLFPCITLASSSSTVGTSMGFVNIMMNICQTIFPMLTGVLQGNLTDYESGYYKPLLLYISGAVCAFFSGILLLIFDTKKLLNAKSLEHVIASVKFSSQYSFAAPGLDEDKDEMDIKIEEN